MQCITLKFIIYSIVWTCRYNVHVHKVRKTCEARTEPGNQTEARSRNWKRSKEIAYLASLKGGVDRKSGTVIPESTVFGFSWISATYSCVTSGKSLNFSCLSFPFCNLWRVTRYTSWSWWRVQWGHIGKELRKAHGELSINDGCHSLLRTSCQDGQSSLSAI